jgi:hypothetical protein
MARARSNSRTLLSLTLAGSAALAAPREARAVVGGGFGLAGFSMQFYNVCSPLGGTTYSCSQAGIRVDPVGTVSHVRMTLDYDWSGPTFTFNAGLSGPLCAFSVGGSCPPANPGSGMEPFVPGINLFTTLPDVAGAPLPGSPIFSVIDNGLAVTLEYQLPAPIAVRTETNFFLFVFDYIVPKTIDISTVAVRYSTAIQPNAEFVLLDPFCDSGPPDHTPCGSTVPAVSIAFTPEPSTVALLATGAAGLALTAARRRRGARRPS